MQPSSRRLCRVLALALSLASVSCSRVEAIDATSSTACAPRVMSRLFFGLDTPAGPVADAAWQAFVDEVVTPRFDEG